MIIDIFGAGSLGLLFYSKLALTEEEIQLNLWTRTEEQASLIREQGVQFYPSADSVSFMDSLTIPAKGSVKPVSDIRQADQDQKADVILVTVKQTHLTIDFVRQLRKRASERTAIICFQNGIRMDNLWGDQWQVYAGITTEGAKKPSAYAVVHSGYGETVIGRLVQGHSTADRGDKSKGAENGQSDAILLLLNLWTKAGLNASMSNNIEMAIYRKLMINAVINPLTALWRIPNGELLQSPERTSVMKRLYKEAIQVYDKADIEWSESLWNDILQVCRATASNTSSMLADVQQGRRTEIGWINGSIVEIGRRHQTAAPGHEWVCALIEAMTTKEAD
ncbi:ketopantoate reductase family protein [Paenibacillus sp. Z6-24]